MQHFAICSNPECNYSTPISQGGILGFLLKHAAEESEDISSSLPEDHYCELCGASLLFYCPHCKIGMFTISNPVHCRHCGEKIKPLHHQKP